MITYMKELYPELTQEDFNKYILPIKKEVESLGVLCLDRVKNVDVISEKEAYPYQNVCKKIVNNIWECTWNTELEQYILDPRSFKSVSCENFSQLAFSYLIRCFAEDIKKTPELCGTAEEVYQFYTFELMRTGFEKFSKMYQVAWSRCNKLIKNKIIAIEKILAYANKHRKDLEEKFNIPKSYRILSIEAGGDTHNDGMSVAIITFERNKKIIFKPRSVSGEAAYSKLIEKINEFICPKMQAIGALNCGNYGFTSYIESNNEKTDMFQAGRLACLMYLLNATDMHYSNILWTDEGPLPIDLETLFHPARVRIGIAESSKSAYRTLETSVYGTGILPLTLSSKTSNASVDVGFTGIRDEKSSSPFKTFDIVDGFTSEIKIVWKKQAQIDNKLSNDKELEKMIHTRCEEMVKGFESLFSEIIKHKDIFMQSVLETFAGANLRYIHNMTYRYVQILRCLSDAEPSKNLDVAHALLSRVAILDTSSDKNIILSECQQLWNGDVPYFSRKFDDTKIYYKNKFVANISLSAKDDFLNKITQLTEQDMRKQTDLIRLAFLAKLADSHAESKLDFSKMQILKEDQKSKQITQVTMNSNEDMKNTISWLSDSLVNSVLDDRYAHLPKTWIGPVVRYRNPGWTPGVLGYDLYAGRIGPALALAAAGKVMQNEKAIKVASDVFDRSAQILGDKTYELRNVLMSGTGAFSGISGLLWALCAACNILGNNAWRKIATESWNLIPDPFDNLNGEFFDMIMGPSAAIVMRYQTQEDWKLNNDAIDKSIALAYTKLEIEDSKKTSGLAHGLAQLIWFFSWLAHKEESVKIKKLIQDIVYVIESRYTDQQGFIQVYSGAKNEVSSSWCNGLVGLLLAYYEGFKVDCVSRQSVVNIINQLKQIPLSSTPILCHGSLGIAEILQYVGKTFPEEVSDIRVKIEKEFCSPNYIYQYFREGKGRYPLSPGLMAGKAGALLYLCRQLEPTINISPLTFGIGI